MESLLRFGPSGKKIPEKRISPGNEMSSPIPSSAMSNPQELSPLHQAGSALPRSPQPVNNYTPVRISVNSPSASSPSGLPASISYSSPDSASSSSSSGPLSPHSAEALRQLRLIVLHTRDLTVIENRSLARHFQNIVVMSPALHSDKNDLDLIQFDCLIVDLSKKEQASWWDEVNDQARLTADIRTVIVRRRNFCMNFAAGYDHIQPDSIIKYIPEEIMETAVFLRKMLAKRGPRIGSIAATVASKVVKKSGN